MKQSMSQNEQPNLQIRIRRVSARTEVHNESHTDLWTKDARSLPKELSRLAIYEIANTSQSSFAAHEVQRTDSPDVALQKAGYSLWQASLLIHRADWLWAHHDSGWVIAAQVDRINADQTRETSNESLNGLHRIRYVCGAPCRKVDRSLRAAIIGQPPEAHSLFEIRREDGQIVRTTEPGQYLTSLGVDRMRDADHMVEIALWKWRAGEYGWYPAVTVEDLPRRVAPKPPKILIRKIFSPQSKCLRMVARLLTREKTQPTYEVATSGTPSGTIITTREPDVVLTGAGLNIWEASALICQVDWSWSLGGKCPWYSSHGNRIIKPLDVSRLDPNEPLTSSCRIRVLNGFPPRNSFVLRSLDHYLKAGVNFAIEYRDETGTIQYVRTQSPFEVLVNVPGVDMFTAEQLCMNALWRWRSKFLGWSQP